MKRKYLFALAVFSLLILLKSNDSVFAANKVNKVLKYNGMHCYKEIYTGTPDAMTNMCDLEFTYRTWYGDYFWAYKINNMRQKLEQSNDDYYHVFIPWKSNKKLTGWLKLRFVGTEIGNGVERIKINEKMPTTL